jgi:hypothetical protein
MNDKIVGPASVVYAVSATVAALWWASNLTARVTALEHSTVTAERIARLEAEVAGLAGNTRELKAGVDSLAHDLRQPK